MNSKLITPGHQKWGWRTILCSIVLLAAASISNGVEATPTMSATAGPTGGQGDSCRGGPPVDTGVFSATFSCISDRGEGITHSDAHAAPGTVGADATGTSFKGVNLGSLSAVGAQGTAVYSDSSGIFLPKTKGVDPQGAFVDVTLNAHFQATATASGLASAAVIAFAYINGETAASCAIRSGGVASCDGSPVHVGLGAIVSTELFINAAIFANANGQLEDAIAVANGLDTFSFVIGGPVFLGLPEDVTFNDPDAFIFNNIYSPPGAAAIPIPATLVLFVSGLGVLGLVGWRRKRAGTIGA